ncbi:MAG: hypothetical protein R3314_14865 [Longimicrobiales bacterium]|nr:hypothetical protein [Longimicrobiales bacterium]
MIAIALVPAALSTVVLAAHFLRAGWLPLVVVLLALIPLLGLRRRWVPRVFEVVLGLGALEWLRTLLELRDIRMALGQPHGRMVAILGAVAVFTALSAALFEIPPVRNWYRRRAGTESTDQED